MRMRLFVLKSDVEPAIVAIQERAKNGRQSNTVLENSPNGDIQSNGAAESVVTEAEGVIRTCTVFVEEVEKYD